MDQKVRAATLPRRWIGSFRMAVVLFWTAVAGFVAWSDYADNRASRAVAALAKARACIEKDIAFRRWAAGHGGVYVPVSPRTPPNPFLDVPERDVTTPSGRHLTLLNPAYMTRQIFEISREVSGGLRGHITSLRPLRPENAPDPWEARALAGFEEGLSECGELMTGGAALTYRYMRPLIVEKPCLKCHASQGYREGMIRGGISVTFSTASLDRAMVASNERHIAAIAATWLLGLGGIVLGFRRIEADAVALAAEQALSRAHEEELRALVENTPDAIARFDTRCRRIYVNPALEALAGKPAARLLGKTPGEESGATPEVGLEIERAVQRVLDEGRLVEIEQSWEDGAGRLRHIQSRLAPERDAAGTVASVLGITREITSLRRAEGALAHAQKMESIGALAGGVAHDFNNLLTVIGGYAELLRDHSSGGGKTAAYAGDILECVTRGTDLARGLLTFSGKRDAQKKYDNLNAIVGNLGKSLSRLLRADITLAFAFWGEEIPVFTDRAQIQQVLMNLIVNARDAVGPGGRISVGTKLVNLDEERGEGGIALAPGRYGLVTVADNGAGMDEATVERIFEPFFTTKAEGEGTGLGLSIAFGIVGSHQGQITVESLPGVGTTFGVYLPVAEDKAVAEHLPKSQEKSLIRVGTTVLVVEDDSDVLRMTSEGLRRFGYTVLTAADGIEALEVFLEHREEIRIVITDLVMPRMNGRQTIERIRELDERLPILLLTGYADKSVDCETLELLRVTLLQKPLRPRELAAEIISALEGKAPGQKRAADELEIGA